MFLRSVQIKNLRSVTKLHLPISNDDGSVRKWTFLLGANGTGKTTILRGIGLVLAGRDALPELLGEPDSWIREGATSAEVRAELVTKEGESRKLVLKLKRGQGVSQIIDANKRSLSDLDRALEYTSRSYLTIAYGVSRRLGDQRTSLGQDDLSHVRAQSMASLFDPGAQLVPFETWAMDQDYRRKQGLRMVKSALKDLVPGVNFHRIDRENRRLLFETPDGLVPLRFLSDGFQNVIGWCGDLLHRVTSVFDDFNKPLEARGLLLIDEVDLHLHPGWQRSLIGFLTHRLPNFQIIVTTHSPFTAQQASSGQLYSLERAGQNITLHPFDGEPRKLLIHQLLMTPHFGSLSMGSLELDQYRDEYVSLRDKKRKSASDKRRIEKLAELLEDQPDWSMTPAAQSELQKMLARINQAKPLSKES